MTTENFYSRFKTFFIFSLFALQHLLGLCSTPRDESSETRLCLNEDNGRTADPYNCCKFIECSGSHVSQQKSCPLGLMFNRTLKLCDWPEKVLCQERMQEIANGDWINGVYTGCHILTRINKMTDIVFKRQKNAVEVLEEINNMTKPKMNTTLSEDELMTTLHTMLRLMEFHPEINDTTTAGVSVPEVTIEQNPRLVYEIASNLLDFTNIATWREIASKTLPNTVLSRLIKLLDDYGLKMTRAKDGDKSLSIVLTDNIAAMIIKSNHRLKRVENETCFQLRESSVCLPSSVLSNSLFSGAVNIIYYTLNHVLLLESPDVSYTRDRHSSGTQHSVESIIVSSTVNPSLQQTQNASVKIVMKNRYSPAHLVNRTCVFWEYENPVNTWSTRGCRMVPQESNNDITTCRCTHLTLFAVLIDPYNVELPRSHRRALELISTAGCSVSLVALSCTILVTSVFWRKLKAMRTKVLLNLCLALATSCVLVIIADAVRDHEILCKLLAVSLHFLLLSAFSWMLCEGILLYYVTTSTVADHEDKIKYFCLLGWGFPAAAVMVTLAVTRVRGYGRGLSMTRTCWLTVDNGLILSFVTPASIVILINIGFLVIVIKRTLSTHLMLTRTDLQRIRAGVKAALVSLPLLGITWSFGLLAFNSDTVYFKYLFAISNSLQGLMIFVFHCALNKKVQEILRLRITRLKQRFTLRVNPAAT